MASTRFQWTFNTQTVTPPTGNQLRFNATDPTTVTKVWVTFTTDDGIDAYYPVMAVDVNTTLFVQDKNNHAQAVQFTVTAKPIDYTTYAELAVSWVASGGAALVGAQAVLGVFVTEAPGALLPGPGATLITVAQAKAHLQRPDLADDDPDLLQKMAASEAVILSYVKKDAYGAGLAANWTSPGTVPLDVQHAVLLQVDEFWRYRGDDVADDEPARDPDAGLSPAIAALLRRSTNPVLA
jgi:hypothetical protein